jgi:hypothetical protein
MYKPLEPAVREFVLSTLVALLRFDVRMSQLSQVVNLDIGSFLRSDVVVDNLASLMGCSLDTTRGKVISAYEQHVRKLVNLCQGKAVARTFGNGKTPSERESNTYLDLAEQCLKDIENLLHAENQGTFTERTKQRLTDRLASKRNGPTSDAVSIAALRPLPAEEQAIMEHAEPAPPQAREAGEPVRQRVTALRERLQQRIQGEQLPAELDEDVGPAEANDEIPEF